MSKYTPEQLQSYAKRALAARDANDVKFLMLVMNLAARSGISPKEAERRIVELAG